MAGIHLSFRWNLAHINETVCLGSSRFRMVRGSLLILQFGSPFHFWLHRLLFRLV